VDTTLNRVQKLSGVAKKTLCQKCRVGSSAGKRGDAVVGANSYNGDIKPFDRLRDYNYDYKPSAPPSFGRYNGGASRSYGVNGTVVTMALVHASCVDRHGIRPSNTLRHTHQSPPPSPKTCVNPVPCKGLIITRDIANYILLQKDCCSGNLTKCN